MRPDRPFSRIPFTLLLGALLASAGCSNSQSETKKDVPTFPVTVAPVEQKTVPRVLRAIGNVEAFSTVAIKSQISGQLMSVHFADGQDVQKSDLLFELDPRPFQADLSRAEANLARDSAQATIAREKAARWEKLMHDGVVSREEHDELQATADAAAAAVLADKAAIESARVNLGYTRILSPISGRTGGLKVHAGNLVKANDDNVSMLTINQVTPIYVYFSVPEQNLAEIKRYLAGGHLQIKAYPPDAGASPSEGLLDFVDNAVDTTTGTIRLRATCANADRRLWPGQFVNVVLTLAQEPDRIVIPSQAIQNGQNGQYVYVVKQDMTVEMRPIAVLRSDAGQSVIQSGLSAGERVVTDGQLRLGPGAHVEIKAAPAAAGQPASPVGT